MSEEVNIAKYYSEYSLGEEIANTLIHGLAALLSVAALTIMVVVCLLYTSPSPRDRQKSRMPSSA